MITGDEIDIAAKKRLLGRFRAVAKFEADVEPVLLPNSRFVHHLPDRQMRMGAIEAAYLHHRLLSHFLSPYAYFLARNGNAASVHIRLERSERSCFRGVIRKDFSRSARNDNWNSTTFQEVFLREGRS